MDRKVLPITPALSIWFENGRPRFSGRGISREEAVGCVREWATSIQAFLNGKPANAGREAYREDAEFAEKWVDEMEEEKLHPNQSDSYIAGYPAALPPFTRPKNRPKEIHQPLPELKRYRDQLASRLSRIKDKIDSD